MFDCRLWCLSHTKPFVTDENVPETHLEFFC